MKDLKSGSLAALTATVFVAAAGFAPKSADDALRADAAKESAPAPDHTVASIAIKFSITGDSLDMYRKLNDDQHEAVDADLWKKLRAGVNEGQVNRMKNYREYDDAPDHHEGHDKKGVVRAWMLSKDILPGNPHDVEGEPGEMEYGEENGVEYCRHTHGGEEDSPWYIHSDLQPRIGARVFVTVTWRLHSS